MVFFLLVFRYLTATPTLCLMVYRDGETVKLMFKIIFLFKKKTAAVILSGEKKYEQQKRKLK